MVHRSLIVGGVAINVSRVPFVVRLYTDVRAIGFCGGSLLAERTVLTAAHCIDPMRTMYVGTYQNDIFANTSETDPASDLVLVENVYVHPQYDPNDIAMGHDVAVLTLSRTPLRYGAANGPTSISLAGATFWPRLSSEQPTDAAYVLGYGARTYGGPQSLYLQSTHVHLYSHEECASILGFGLSDSNMCAGLPGSDSCSGDSGGPLVVAYDGNFVQVGIVSWGVSYADCGDVPGIYSLTSSEHDILAPRGARYVDHTASPSVEDACACADDCISNGFSVVPRCGCADHVGDGHLFCYVHHEDCPNATHSSVFLGALYRSCTILSLSPPIASPGHPPPVAPSPLPPSPPPPIAPSPVTFTSPVVIIIPVVIVVCILLVTCFLCAE